MAFSPHSVYGLEWCDGRATIAHGRRRRGRVDITMLAREADPTHPDWPAIQKQMETDQAQHGALVAALAPASESFVRPVEAPFDSIPKARAVLPSLLDVQLPFPLEQCAYQFVGVTKSAAGAVKALALAMPVERLNKLAEEWQAAGLAVENVVPESLVLWRYFERHHPPVAAARPRVIFYLTLQRVLALAGWNGQPASSFHARIPAAGDSAARDKWRVRLKQFLAGALRNAAMDLEPEFWIAGPLAAIEGDRLREVIGAEPTRWNQIAEPAWLLPHALAEACLVDEEDIGNLRTGRLAHPIALCRERKKVNQRLGMIAAAALILAGVSATSTWITRHAHDRWQRAVQAKAAEITGLQVMPRGQEVFLAQQAIAGSADASEPFHRWQEPGAYPLFLRVARTAHARGINLETLAVRPASVLIRGAVADWNEADLLTQLLNKEGWRAEIERSDAGHDEQVHFTVRAQP